MSSAVKYTFSAFLFFSVVTTTILGLKNNKNVVVVEIEKSTHPIQVVDEEFISFGIDTVEILKPDFKTRLQNERLINYTKLLGPSILRFGGTFSDRLYFLPKNAAPQTGPVPFFTVEEDDLFNLFQFAKATNSRVLFDLNVLLRNGKHWDTRNAIEIMRYCTKNKFQVDWQLGNEPNSFKHVFNTTVTPEQLSDDYMMLHILRDTFSSGSFIVGPDTTRPQPKRPDAIRYMKEFLSNFTFPMINAISWHQYYLNGRTATLEDMWNIDTLELLQSQIDTMNENINEHKMELPMWLTETSSAYGGGAPGLSDSYGGSALWLDKLGLAARNGISVIIRQSLIGASYSMLDDDGNPLPDYWISYYHKNLVGQQVVPCKVNYQNQVRVYCHCTSIKYPQRYKTITVFAVNLMSEPRTMVFKGAGIGNFGDIDEYVVTPLNGNRLSKIILVNGILPGSGGVEPKTYKLLANTTTQIPPFAIAFWVIHNATLSYC